MNPLLISALVQQHIADLQRQAALRRLVHDGRKRTGSRRQAR